MMTIGIDELLREIDVLNWYRGEALKRGEETAVMVQTAREQQTAMMYHMETARTMMMARVNTQRVRMTCDVDGEEMTFTLTPIRRGKEYLLEMIRGMIKQYLVAETRRLWMMNINPQWADATMRETMEMNLTEMIALATDAGPKVRRRCAVMGI